MLPPPAYALHSGQVILEFRRGTANPVIPHSLEGYIGLLEYNERVAILRHLFARYIWSWIERIYIVLAVLVTAVIPWPIYFIVVRKLESQSLDVLGNLIDPGKITEARLVELGTLLGLAVCVWLPYIAFKVYGGRQIDRTLKSFNTVDFVKGTSSGLVWKNLSTNHWTAKALIAVQLPVNPNFGDTFNLELHPNTDLPPSYPPLVKQQQRTRSFD